METVEIDIGQIKVREDIYPRARFQVDLKDTYKAAMERGDVFPPLALEKDTHLLLDGVHRYRAYRELGLKKVRVDYIVVPEGETPKYVAAKLNARHGERLTNGELKEIAVEMAKTNVGAELVGLGRRIAKDLSVPERTAQEWIKDILSARREERDVLIFRLALLGWTQEEIGQQVGLTQKAVSLVLEETANLRKLLLDTLKSFTPPVAAERLHLPELLVWSVALDGKPDAARFEALGLERRSFNVWNFADADDRFGLDYPGRIPGQSIANLLAYYTELSDLVLDPMAGGGTTVDVCLVLGRRCLAYDLVPHPERKDVRAHDLRTGFPDLGKRKPALVLLDPPYWRLKRGEYPEGTIGAGGYEVWLQDITTVAKACAVLAKGCHVALYAQSMFDREEEKRLLDLPFDCLQRFRAEGLVEVQRISVPMSTQQYDKRDMKYGEEHNIVLDVNREVLVFKVE